jgi:sulfite exporter TauE/SafE
MCGPIALALPGTQHFGWHYLVGRLLYNMGRIVSYSLMGGLVALLGVAAAMFDVQRWFSLGLGATLVCLALVHFGVFGAKAQAKESFLTRWWRRAMGQVLKLKGHGGLFLIGLLNGLLPCGLVYAGLFLAANSSTALEGMGKMAFFGAGTLPLMLTLSWSGKWLASWLRPRARLVMPTVMVFLGVMFLLRGMALGIPYLSPKLEKADHNGKVKMSCCELIVDS